MFNVISLKVSHITYTYNTERVFIVILIFSTKNNNSTFYVIQMVRWFHTIIKYVLWCNSGKITKKLKKQKWNSLLVW